VKTQNSERYVKQLQWFAHQSHVNSISFLESPDGIATCSTDKHVKLWSLDGALWGDINLLKENWDKQWTYPFDWTEKREQDVSKVQKLMALIDPPRPAEASEEQVRFEQRQQKERDQRETIDYLAKRKRRMDFEEYLRRIERQKIEAMNQDQIKAQYVSSPSK